VISVQERMPPEFTPVWVLIGEVLPWQAMREGTGWLFPSMEYNQGRVYRAWVSRNPFTPVTHWMPIPKVGDDE